MARGELCCFFIVLFACSSSDDGPTAPEGIADDDGSSEVIDRDASTIAPLADVTAVSVTGNAGDYRFSVTVSSPDTGCDQYADWWEVLGESGDLLYRRVLLHSHVGEQPFSRSGGPVAADQVVWVRAHMNPQGYGGVAFKGTVQDGFAAAAQDLLPADCDF